MIEPLQNIPAAPPGPVDRVGTLREGAFTLWVRERVLDQILEYSEQGVRRELGGFLLGGLHVDAGPAVEIRHFVPATAVHSQMASLVFTHETWAQLQRECEEHYPQELLVGWHHTHPNFGVFLSAYDLFIHRNFFRQPWQVALVVDPRRQEFGFFQWSAAEVVDCGFLCLRSHDNDTRSTIH